MLKNNVLPSAAALFSAASLLVPAQGEAPRLEPSTPNEHGHLRLAVAHNIVDHDRLHLEFSPDLREWRAAVLSGTVRPVGSDMIPEAPERMISYIEWAPRFNNQNDGGFLRAIVGQPIVPFPIYGLNFSPYIGIGEDPNHNIPGLVSERELFVRLERVAPYTEWVRSFGTTSDLQPIGRLAHQLGLKAAVGAWLSKDIEENQRQLDTLVTLALNGEVDVAIVGSETILRGDLTPQQLIDYMNEVRGRLNEGGVNIPVVTADVYSSFLNNPELIEATDQIWANFYPYWEGRDITCALAYLDQSYHQLLALAGEKEVVVSESGHPTCGQTIGAAVPSPANAADYLQSLVSWATHLGVKYFYFGGYDEGWKARHEGPQGACWGVWTSTGQLKPGMERPFLGERLPLDQVLHCPPTTRIIDVFSGPAEVTTNIGSHLVSGTVNDGEEVRINGRTLDDSEIHQGTFAAVVALEPGANLLEVAVYAPGAAAPRQSVNKLVFFDPNFSTRNKRLLYVDLVSDQGGQPALDGTAVIDLDGDAVLGFMPNRHVRGVAPGAGHELYMADLGVLSSSDHSEIRRLAFSDSLDHQSFVVNPNSTQLISRREVLDLPSNTVRFDPLPLSLHTGSSWKGARIPGGPAAAPDGQMVFFGNDVMKLDLAGNTVESTGISGFYMSDLTVSPDGKLLALSEYSWGQGFARFYDTQTFQLLGSAWIGDFSGEIVFSGRWAIAGSHGNSAYGRGRVSVIDTTTFTVTDFRETVLADNLTVTERGEVLVTVGLPGDGVQRGRQGVDVFCLNEAGQLEITKSFFMGPNRFTGNVDRPNFDQIRALYYKPSELP